MFYLIFLFSIVVVIRNIKLPAFLLIFAIFIQVLDIEPIYNARGLDHFVEYQTPLQSDFWPEAGERFENIILYPADNSAMDFYGPIAEFAQQNSMNLNWAYFARGDKAAFRNYAEAEIKKFQQGQIDADTLFIFYDEQGQQIIDNITSNNVLICEIDGYKLGFINENILDDNNKLWINFCHTTL